MKNIYALLFMLLVFAVLAPLPALADTWQDQISCGCVTARVVPR